MTFSLFIIEVVLLLLLIRNKKKTSHPFVIVFSIAFFYLNAPLLDHFFLNIKQLRYIDRYIDFKSNSFLYYCYYKLLFFVAFFFFLIKKNKRIVYYFKKNEYTFKIKKEFLLSLLLLVLSLYNLNNLIVNTISTRSELALTQTPFSLILRNFTNYLFIILFCLKVKKSMVYNLFIWTSILYFFFAFEREPLVILFFCIIYTKKVFSGSKILVLTSLALLPVLFLWKVIYSSLLYKKGGGVQVVQDFYKEQVFSFSGLDPGSSFKIFYEYLEGTISYSNYSFTYFTGVLNQVYRMFFVSDYKTLAEYSSIELVGSRYGVAFSFLLESILNFSVLGPVIISYLILIFINHGMKLQSKYGAGIIVCCIYIVLKLMRTEIATIVKLEIFPLVLVLLFFTFFIKKLKTNNEP